MLFPRHPYCDSDDGGGAAPAPTPPSTPTPPSDDLDLTARLATLEEQLTADRQSLRNERAARAIDRAAVANNINPELLTSLVTPAFDDNGQPTGVDEAVTALLAKFPQLATPGATPLIPSSTVSPSNPARAPKATSLDDQVNAAWSKRGRDRL